MALGGCQIDGTLPTNSKAMAPLSGRILAEINDKNMDKEAPILVRIFKQEAELEVWKQDRNGRFALLKTYPICRWSGELGPKFREGDRQAPEGFYTITPTQMNPNSQFYLSFDLGYPNAYDRAHGRTGANLMVHGDCSSRGCYSMTDEQVSEIYALGREAFFGGQKSFQVQAYPFRMTPQNLAKHRNNPHLAFWKMLKRGNDHFEITRLEPKVNVCEKHYVFDAEAPGDPLRPLAFSPAGKCPMYQVPTEVADAVKQKQHRDEVEYAALVRRGVPTAPVKTYADGGMHPVFAAAVKRNEVGVPPNAFSLAAVPGTIPPTVQPPKTPEFANLPDNTTVTASTPAPNAAPAQPEPAKVATSEPTAQPANAASTTGTFFSGLVSSTSKLIGIDNSEPKTTPVPQPKAKVAAKPVRAKPAPAKPASTKPAPATTHVKPAETKATETKPVVNAKVEKPVAAPAPAAAAPAPKPANSTIAGAAPTVPAGSFDTRWQAFR